MKGLAETANPFSAFMGILRLFPGLLLLEDLSDRRRFPDVDGFLDKAVEPPLLCPRGEKNFDLARQLRAASMARSEAY
ncbi:MAG TPA: hypothetical protein DCG53_08785 [Syntrophus sp. (in: bacteria)]|jgi:hypothetical protein|nr:hypothetical protein [Syntrophus sp. (in: bacteria)]